MTTFRRSFFFSIACLALATPTVVQAVDCPTYWYQQPCTSTELPGNQRVCDADGSYAPKCEGSNYADRFFAFADGSQAYVFGEIHGVLFCCTSDEFGTPGHLWIEGNNLADEIYTYYEADVILSWEHDTSVDGGDGDDQIFLNPYPGNTETAWGRGGDDTIMGNDGADVIYGGDGNDTLDAGDGDIWAANVVHGDRGDDTIHGSDWETGDGPHDELCGCSCELSAAHCDGHSDQDRIWGREGDDYIVGGGDFDVIHGEGDADMIYGDYLPGYEGTDESWDNIYGGDGGDLIRTGGGDWGYASGGSGGDEIFAEGRWTTVEGGNGGDTIDASNGYWVIIDGEAEADTIYGSPYADTLNGSGGNDTIDGAGGDDTINGGIDSDTLTGGDGNDTISGGDGSDTLWGGDGDDTLRGEAGEDYLYGQAGQDTIRGGTDEDCAEGGEGFSDFDYSYGGVPEPGDTFIDPECGFWRCQGHGWTTIQSSGSCQP